MLLLIRKEPAALVARADVDRGGASDSKRAGRAARNVDVSLLPYRPDIIELVRAEKASGRTLILATASHRSVASGWQAMSADSMKSSPAEMAQNLKEKAKLAELERRFGAGNFD